METRVLEGTWEEITRQASRLAGRKVRVTILDEEPERQSKPNEGMLEALDRKSTRLNSSHSRRSRMPSSA